MEHSEKKVEYIRLSEQGREKYMQVFREGYMVMTFWMVGGALSGFAISKLLGTIPYLKDNYYIRKYKFTPFFILFMSASYHGYKLMNFTRRKGTREIAKDPANLIQE